MSSDPVGAPIRLGPESQSPLPTRTWLQARSQKCEGRQTHSLTACAHAQRHLDRSAMSTRSTAYAPVLTASAVERAEGVDLKACAEARRELATSSLATLNAVFALCDPELTDCCTFHSRS